MDDGLAVLSRPPGQSPQARPLQDPTYFELHVRGYGPDDEPAQRLIALVQAWAGAGRPTSARLAIRAYPAEPKYDPAPGEFVITKPWTQLVIDWQ